MHSSDVLSSTELRTKTSLERPALPTKTNPLHNRNMQLALLFLTLTVGAFAQDYVGINDSCTNTPGDAAKAGSNYRCIRPNAGDSESSAIAVCDGNIFILAANCGKEAGEVCSWTGNVGNTPKCTPSSK